MLRAKVAIERTPEGLWKAGNGSIRIDTAREISLSRMRPEETLGDLFETVMGAALLALDKNDRRGTSEPIQWEITVDGMPHCFCCVEPMREIPRPWDAWNRTGRSDWMCLNCGTMIRLGS